MINKMFIVLFLMVTVSLQAATSEQDINGYYLTADQKAQVRFFKATNGMYYGRIVWLNEKMKGQKDVKNPNQQLRERDVKGIFIVSELSFDGERWSGGRIYDPWTGNSYDCYAYFDESKETLFLRAYRGNRLIGKTLEWSREERQRK